MATESTIRKRAKEKLEDEGWDCYWIPTATTWHSNDVFGIYDVLAWKRDQMRWIQYTSRDHVSHRVNKINDFKKEHDVSLPPNCKDEVWGYENRKGFTRIVNLTD